MVSLRDRTYIFATRQIVTKFQHRKRFSLTMGIIPFIKEWLCKVIDISIDRYSDDNGSNEWGEKKEEEETIRTLIRKTAAMLARIVIDRQARSTHCPVKKRSLVQCHLAGKMSLWNISTRYIINRNAYIFISFPRAFNTTTCTDCYVMYARRKSTFLRVI